MYLLYCELWRTDVIRVYFSLFTRVSPYVTNMYKRIFAVMYYPTPIHYCSYTVNISDFLEFSPIPFSCCSRLYQCTVNTQRSPRWRSRRSVPRGRGVTKVTGRRPVGRSDGRRRRRRRCAGVFVTRGYCTGRLAAYSKPVCAVPACKWREEGRRGIDVGPLRIL